VSSLAVLSAALAAGPARAVVTVFAAGGTPSPASIQPTVDSFRAALGNPNNGNNPGPLGAGRREINWDGGGALVAAASGPTLSAFTNTRGATMTTPGTGFLQTPLDDVAFTGIQPTYQTTFSVFSPSRLFTPLGSNITDVAFSIPGSAGAVPAFVEGFGAVFSDVDLANTTSIELFDVGGASLGTFFVPQGTPTAAPSASLSFLGLLANAGEQIARVRITTGNGPLGPVDTNGNPNDLAVMDDFIYGEPELIPEPASLALAAAALLGLAAASRRTMTR
jgi:hypothetical protein